MEQIKTYEDACKKLNKDPRSLPDVSNLKKRDRQQAIDSYKLTVISQALNEPWHSEFESGPKFKRNDLTRSSRLVFNTKDNEEYAHKQFGNIYEESFGKTPSWKLIWWSVKRFFKKLIGR